MSITKVATVTRTELALGDLALEEEGVYKLMRDAVGPGDGSWRREVSKSAYVHGETLVGAVKDVMTAQLGVRVLASSISLLQTRVSTLLTAFSQFSYNLTITLDGSTWQWKCEPADYAIGDGGVFQDLHLLAYQQEVRLNIPRHPIPLQGSV